MNKFTHFKPAVKTAFYSYWTLFKEKFGLRMRPTSRVIHAGMDNAVSRYTRICKTLLEHIPDKTKLNGAIVAEIGFGDCFASADMMLGLDTKHVHLIEFLPLNLTEDNRKALTMVADDPELPNRCELIPRDGDVELDPRKATYHQGFLEDLEVTEKVDFLYSFDVLEHVEDLDGFFNYCEKAVKPGGIMLHKFDLSGHGLFEDPMPPLDFQIFPTWLFNLIFVKYKRAVGRFEDEFIHSMEKYGFTVEEVIPIRVADKEYVDEIWPHLRKEARQRDRDRVAILDVVFIARRNG
jgi:SAM-dependent methyltransferase